MRKTIIFSLASIFFILLTYMAVGWEPLSLPTNKIVNEISGYEYKGKNTIFKKIDINKENSIKLKFEFEVLEDNNYSNIFQTDYLNEGIRLELNKNDLSLIVYDERFINNYKIYSFKTKIRKNVNYKFDLLAIKNVGYIVKLNDESYIHAMYTFRPKFNNFIIGKGYNDERFFIGNINNIKNEAWTTNPYSALFFELRKNILYLTSVGNNKSTIDISSFYDVYFLSTLNAIKYSYIISLIMVIFIGLLSLNLLNTNLFKRSKIEKYFITIFLLVLQVLLISSYSFYNYFIISILLLYIFGYMIFKYLFPDALKDNLSYYIFPPMAGLILISIIGGYSLTLGFDPFFLLTLIGLVSVLFILKHTFIDFYKKDIMSIYKNKLYVLLCSFSLIVTPVVFLLLYPLILHSETSFVRIGPDMFFYAKMAQFIQDGGLLEYSRLRVNEFNGLSTGEINKYSDATASWPFMYFYRWGLGFYQYCSILISSSIHSYNIVFASLVLPYIFVSTVVFFWLYKNIKLSLFISLLGFLAFALNANMLNIWYEGFYANTYSLFMFIIFILIFYSERNSDNFSKIKNFKSIALYTIILVSIIMSYAEGLFFILMPFVFFILIYDYFVKNNFNYFIYRNIIISGVLSILFILPSGFFIEWVGVTINQISQEGGNGYMQPKWALPHEIIGFNNIYHDIKLTNGGQRIGRMPIDWVYSTLMFYLFFLFYFKTIKKYFNKINSIYGVSHILVAVVGLIVLVKSTHNNYLYMKYYIFLLPYIFLFFWEYITTFSFRVKNKNYSLTESKKNILMSFIAIYIISSGVSYIYKYSEQAEFIPKKQIELYVETKNIDFTNVIIYPLRYKKYLNAYPAIIKTHFIAPSFKFKHAKKISNKKVYVFIEKYNDEKYFYDNDNVILQNDNYIILDSKKNLKNYMNEKTKKMDFKSIKNMLIKNKN